MGKKRQSYGHQMLGRKWKFVKVDLLSRWVTVKLLFCSQNFSLFQSVFDVFVYFFKILLTLAYFFLLFVVFELVFFIEL